MPPVVGGEDEAPEGQLPWTLALPAAGAVPPEAPAHTPAEALCPAPLPFADVCPLEALALGLEPVPSPSVGLLFTPELPVPLLPELTVVPVVVPPASGAVALAALSPPEAVELPVDWALPPESLTLTDWAEAIEVASPIDAATAATAQHCRPFMQNLLCLDRPGSIWPVGFARRA